MHPNHAKDIAAERVASTMRAAERRRLVAEARASAEADEPSAGKGTRRRGFRIPLIGWELRMQPAIRAGR